jgi:hypothetical protein
MVGKIMPLLNKAKTLLSLLKLSKSDKVFCDFSKKKWNKNSFKKNKGEIITDFLIDDLYIFQISYLANYFVNNFGLTPKYFQFIHREKFLLRLFYSFFRKFTRMHKLYQSFGSDFAFGQTKYKKSKTIAASISFKSKVDLLDFEIDNIKIGDLIYDTYLRTYHVATVDLSDKMLSKMMINVLDVYFSCKDYLDNHNVQKIILSHSVYINYGILARIALKKGIEVYNPLQERVIHKLSPDHHLPTARHSEYAKLFRNFSSDNQEKCRNEAKLILEGRLEGEIDRGIFFMLHSPYKIDNNQEKIFLNNGKPKVVLMLHDFYDSPHIYQSMIFEDFHEWFDFILSNEETMDVDLVVKPHPLAKPYNEHIIDDFKRKYPKIRYIDKNTSNKKIISEGVSALLSVYGSVASEFAYLGIPVLLAGDSPVVDYNFCYTAKNKKDFEYYLLNINELMAKIDFSKSKIEEFFYMHYLHIHMGRINGNNDVFNWMKNYNIGRDYNFLHSVKEANEGKFDNVFKAFDEAIVQLDEY